MDILNLLQNHNMQTTLFIFFIGISLIQLFDMKIIVSIIVLILVVINYKSVIKSTDTRASTRTDVKKHEISDDMYYNTRIHTLLSRLKKFKKYNNVSYKSGVLYMRQFFKTIHILEKDKILNYNQYYENAHLYLKSSLNHFQSMTVSLPERTMINAIKYGDYESTKKANELGAVCKELYNECYYILLNLSIKFNETWSKNPTINTKEIDINTDRVEQYNEHDEVNWTLY